MILVDFKYRDNKGKIVTITKYINPACIHVDNIYIGKRKYWISSREYHIDESKIVVWLKS